MYQVAKSERELYCLFVNFFIDDKGAVRNKSERNSLKDKTMALFPYCEFFLFIFFFFFWKAFTEVSKRKKMGFSIIRDTNVMEILRVYFYILYI